MAETVTVWAVDLVRDPGTDRKGTLSLEPGALVFTAAAGGSDLKIGLEEVSKARRLRGSPVLLVVHDHGGQRRRTAFFFVQPPPLEPMLGRVERPSAMPFGRAAKRRARRQNAGYLGLWNREMREDLLAWERRVREAIRATTSS